MSIFFSIWCTNSIDTVEICAPCTHHYKLRTIHITRQYTNEWKLLIWPFAIVQYKKKIMKIFDRNIYSVRSCVVRCERRAERWQIDSVRVRWTMYCTTTSVGEWGRLFIYCSFSWFHSLGLNKRHAEIICLFFFRPLFIQTGQSNYQEINVLMCLHQNTQMEYITSKQTSENNY